MADLQGKIKIWSQTAADFASDNPTLERGQFGFEYDTLKLKCGDGATAYDALAYISGSGGGGAWGTITGTLSDQTDLQNALDAKEATSNKQTDLTPSSTKFPTVDAVLAALANIWPRFSGKRYTFPYIGSVTTNAGWGESLIYIPIPVLFPHVITHVTCRVTIAVAGANIRLGAATCNSVGYPTTLYEESGNISAASTGDKTFEFTTPIEVTGKLIYAVIATSSNLIGLLAAGSNVVNFLERPAGTNVTPAQYRSATTFAPIPSVFPAGQNPVNSYGIIIEFTMQ